MIGILVISHGMLSEGILNSTEMLMGKQKDYDFISIKDEKQLGELPETICRKIASMDDGDGVLVLADIFGGSPSNALIENFRNYKVECITGMNLPMLIEAFNNRRDMPLEELAGYCCEVGSSGIRNIGKFLKSMKI